MTLGEWLGMGATAIGTLVATYGAVRDKLDTSLGKTARGDIAIRDLVMEMKGTVEQVAASTSRLEWGQDKLADRVTKLEVEVGLGREEDTPPHPRRQKMPSSH